MEKAGTEAERGADFSAAHAHRRRFVYAYDKAFIDAIKPKDACTGLARRQRAANIEGEHVFAIAERTRPGSKGCDEIPKEPPWLGRHAGNGAIP